MISPLFMEGILLRQPVVNERAHRAIEQDSFFIFPAVNISSVQGHEDWVFVVVDPHWTSAHAFPGVERMRDEFGRIIDWTETRSQQLIRLPERRRVTLFGPCVSAANNTEPTKDPTLAPIHEVSLVDFRK
jgi:hypothetical protein